jgi:hypothetical protein
MSVKSIDQFDELVKKSNQIVRRDPPGIDGTRKSTAVRLPQNKATTGHFASVKAVSFVSRLLTTVLGHSGREASTMSP